MRMSAEGDICNVVLPNNTAVEVIVVNPVQMDASIFDHVKVLKKTLTIRKEEPGRKKLECIPQSFDFSPT